MEYKRFKKPNEGFSFQLFYLKRKRMPTRPAKKPKPKTEAKDQNIKQKQPHNTVKKDFKNGHGKENSY